MMTAKNNRIGEVGFNKFGSKMTIVEYNNALDITVIFNDSDYIVKCKYGDFKRGLIKNVYDKSVYDVGYIGEGKYKTYIDGVKSNEYTIWLDMLRRGYDCKFKSRYPTYADCTVCEDWHNFQNFCEWYYENYYEINGETMSLDKDILVKGNKIYSPSTCVFTSQNVNSLFAKSNKIRGDLPIGVTLYKRTDKYMSQCKDGFGKRIHLGYFDTPEKAFYSYKSFKEDTIRKIAERYKDRIPSKLYDALISYKVEIND